MDLNYTEMNSVPSQVSNRMSEDVKRVFNFPGSPTNLIRYHYSHQQMLKMRWHNEHLSLKRREKKQKMPIAKHRLDTTTRVIVCISVVGSY